MALYISSLNSGSNGNCYYIGNDNEAILIDAGISCREIEKRMRTLDLSMKKIKAIFISHEHTDHIKGIPVLSEKYKIPVYVTSLTRKHLPFKIKDEFAIGFKPDKAIDIGELSVTAFPKKHDAADPHSFIITSDTLTIGVFTDIGNACDAVKTHFSKCQAAFLEANYDEVLLEKGKYPVYLKNRIRGENGHLSNNQALDLFLKFKSPNFTHLFLSHLSKENNCPIIASKLFKTHEKNVEIIVAGRYKETSVYKIQERTGTGTYNEQHISSPLLLQQPIQMSLF